MPSANNDLALFEELIGYQFKDKKLLQTALTHSSYLNENKEEQCEHNERLEFFGDAIIEFYVSDYLFHSYSDLPEGDLTRIRASMVCEAGLASCARDIRLGEFIFMGRGEEAQGGRTRASITSDAFEALVAAIYLDSGRDSTEKFINDHLLESLKDKQLFFDAKTQLQEIIQKNGSNSLKYEIIAEDGPIHSRTFTAAVYLNGEEIGRGQGHSKKEAQQQAAACAITR